MSGYEILLKERKDWNKIYQKYKNIFLRISPFLIIISIYGLLSGYNDDQTFAQLNAFVNIFLFILFASLSILSIFSMKATQIITFYSLDKNMITKKEKILEYIKVAILKSKKMAMFSVLSAIFFNILVANLVFLGLPFIPFGISTLTLCIVYMTSLLPLRYVYNYYKSLYVIDLIDSAESISVSCNIIDRELRLFLTIEKDLNIEILKLNVFNIKDNVKTNLEITKYFKENMNPPTIVDLVRFCFPAILSILLSEMIPVNF